MFLGMEKFILFFINLEIIIIYYYLLLRNIKIGESKAKFC